MQKIPTSMNRRVFLKSCAAMAGPLLTANSFAATASGDGPPQKQAAGSPDGVFPSYQDEKTGARIFNLTPGGGENQIIYQTHPMWTRNMEHLVFHSQQEGHGGPWMLEMKSGKTRPVPVESYATGTMTWKNNALYYLADRTLYVLDLIQAFHGEGKPKQVGRLPDACLSISGTVTVDADLSAFYFGGVLRENKAWGVFAIDLKTGEGRMLAKTDFQVGHFQANPFTPGSLMFCQETGGDAEQRIWHLNVNRPEPAPLYKETYGEWVTHEVWWSADRIIFTLWPYDDAHKELPHGVATADIHTGPKGTMKILSQYPAWHTHGSPDGQWALGDDFERNLWLIRVASGERKLLMQGYDTGKWKTHPHASFTPDSGGIVLNASKNDAAEIFYIPLPPWETLP